MLFAEIVFAETTNVLDGVSDIITAVGAVVVGLTGLFGVLLQFYIIFQNTRQSKTASQERQRASADIQAKVEETAKPLIEGVEVVKKQTNGITERAEKSAADAAEAKAVLQVTAEKLKKYDPNSTVLKKAEEIIEKKKQSDADGTPPSPVH